MSKQALAQVVQRAISDAAFRRQLNSDPAGALRGFDLSADEASAIRTGDAGRLSTLGVDQRMSKAFAIGGGLASTRLAASDLTPGGGPSAVDDLSGAGGRTVIPADPRTDSSADIDGAAGTAGTVRAGDDYKFAGRIAPDGSTNVRTGDDWKFADRQAPDASSARVGDDWKFTDRVAAQGSAAPVEGSPEATAAENATAGGGMAAYPEHYGLAGPSGTDSVRAGDDWARSSAAAGDSGRIGSARLDDASGGASGGAAAINDDPDGFLAANKDADFSNPTVRSAINDDPNGFLAANATPDTGGVVRAINDDPDGFLAANANASTDTGGVVRSINDDPDGFLAANANADVTNTASRGDGTAYIDESEEYLTKVGYDSSVKETAVTDAHERTWSGDDIAGQSAEPSSGEGNVTDHTDGSSLTP